MAVQEIASIASVSQLRYLSLSFQHGGAHVLLAWLLMLVIVELPCCLDLAPVLGTVSFNIQGFDEECPFSGFGVFVAMPVSILTFFLAPYFPDMGAKKQSCFLDVVSINQGDSKMMQQGIYGFWALFGAHLVSVCGVHHVSIDTGVREHVSTTFVQWRAGNLREGSASPPKLKPGPTLLSHNS